MGARFKLRHTNLMAYVTDAGPGTEAPRASVADLVGFLLAFADHADLHLISHKRDSRRLNEVRHVARQALLRLQEDPLDTPILDMPDTILPSALVSGLLKELKHLFSSYAIFVLAVGRGEELDYRARELAKTYTNEQLLVLIPDLEDYLQWEKGDAPLDARDPLKVFSDVLRFAPLWPGFHVWTKYGENHFVPLEYSHYLLEVFRHPGIPVHMRPNFYSVFIEDLRKEIRFRGSVPRGKKILHLSDLHFGNAYASLNRQTLEAQLRSAVEQVDRVVITGDLIDRPKKNLVPDFMSFRNMITAISPRGVEPIVITGNHDQRNYGILKNNYAQAFKFGGPRVVVDDDMAMSFICFNSSERGRYACGEISDQQFVNLGAEYLTKVRKNPERKGYLPVALVHHHPFTYDAEPETKLQRVIARWFSKVGLTEERLLQLKNAEHLHEWCVDNKIMTILHGHKHQARYYQEKVSSRGQDMELTAIGCGSSLGAEGSPVSYNMIEWDPSTSRWTVRYFESVRGACFRETLAAVQGQKINNELVLDLDPATDP